MKLAVVIVTCKRVLDAKIQMELIRNLWSNEPELRNIKIYHVYNGKKEWYPKKYLENSLIRRRNLGFYSGAADSIDSGIEAVLGSKDNFDYIILASADVWLVKPNFIANLLNNIRGDYYLASSRWFFQNALATEFFLIKPSFARKVFPLNLADFKKKHKFISCFLTPVLNTPMVEYAFAERIKAAVKQVDNSRERVYLIPQRRNVHWLNHRLMLSFGYISLHNLLQKRKILLKLNLKPCGPVMKDLFFHPGKIGVYA